MHTLPTLDYDYDALEPHIDARTMEIHHSKHHQGYVDNLNAALEGHDDLRERPIDDLLRGIDDVPEVIRQDVINNGGGHANHSLFWTVMSPDGGGNPSGDLEEAIKTAFGGVDAFRKAFSEKAAGRFGSGWAWVTVDNGQLAVGSTANQNSPLMEGGTPILGLDVWEHAYYLHYQNRRGDYIEAFWNVVDWDEVSRRFEEAM